MDGLQIWVTTDHSNSLHVWDLETERLAWQLARRDVIKSQIVEVRELVHLRMTAIASLDKRVTVWNLPTRTFVLAIELQAGGVHHIAYSYDF